MQDVVDGVEAAIRLYYDEYSDAEELDFEFYRAIDRILDVTYAGPTQDFVEQVQESITAETGRKFA
jgi:hypothetical protein